MADHSLTLYIFLLANITIALGYIFLALAVLPKIPITLVRTKIGGVGFFLLCGLTHLDMAISSLFHAHLDMVSMVTSWHSLAIHVPQAVAVWMFVTGLYIEVGRWDLPIPLKAAGDPGADPRDGAH